jgi:hypothetical protein
LQFGLGKAGNRAEQGVRIMRRRRSQSNRQLVESKW